eukprot:TRINITY_DN39622_c0_g1_i1.p1 TRINITY_DN39622_c0_g1~~TRINITY_DN39622_c0_g1_i1.p1  ORF type:complete len:1292 (+),score=456.26 TRINITY_DN39622_c0_g1_i1:82-3957(+)
MSSLTGIHYDLQLRGLLGDMAVTPLDGPCEGFPDTFKPQVPLDVEDFRGEVHAELERDFDAEDLLLGTNSNPLFRASKVVSEPSNSFPTSSVSWPLTVPERQLLADAPPERNAGLACGYHITLDDLKPGDDFVNVVEEAAGLWTVDDVPAHDYWLNEDATYGGDAGEGERQLAALDGDTKGLVPPGWSGPLIIDSSVAPLGGAGERVEEEPPGDSRCRNKSTFLSSANEQAEAFARGDLGKKRVVHSRNAAPIDFNLHPDVDEEVREEVQNFDFASLAASPQRSPARRRAEQPKHASVADLADACARDFDVVTTREAGTTEGTWDYREEWSEASPALASEFAEVVPDPAIVYDFELDNFQKQAVMHIERNENVFVAAHTSAGKTVCAEYAIALSQKRRTRVLYTSPIKTLSNQKFRDFQDKFEDVGILTGDVQINSAASCLIMTTEILRSMLYRNSKITQDVEYVVFDEVHYVNDADRGYVWEEVIIMLPKRIKLIMLSATVPNTKEFADWVGRTRGSPVYVITTMKRPVPLMHSVFYKDQERVVVEAGKPFDSKVYCEVLDAHKQKVKELAQRGGGPKGDARVKNERREWLRIIRYLQEKDRLPVIIFDFSKKRLDEMSEHLWSLNFTTRQEKAAIEAFTRKALRRLKGTDKSIPQVLRVFSLLRRGVAVHHAGLMPIMKEVVEVLFCKGLIRVLFATETFAMGVNAPARSVVFAAMRKHDGTGLRDLRPGEYTQMAGRAGRRGLDTVGHVLIACIGSDPKAVPDQATMRGIITGKPLELVSKFRITYAMVINLILRKRIAVGELLRCSFSEARANKYHPVFCALRDRYRGQLSIGTGFRGDATDAAEFYEAVRAWAEASKDMTARMVESQPARALPLGKVVVVESTPMVFNLAFVVTTVGTNAVSCVVLKDLKTRAYRPRACGVPLSTAEAEIDIVDLPRSRIVCMTKMSVVEPIGVPMGGKMGKMGGKMQMQMPAPRTMLSASNPTALRKEGEKLRDIVRKGLDAEDGVEVSKAFDTVAREERESALQFILSHPYARTDAEVVSADMEICHARAEAERRSRLYDRLASDGGLWLMPEFRVRTKVFEHLQFVEIIRGEDEEDADIDKLVPHLNVCPKGKCAAEINSIDSVLATEIIFEGLLDQLSPPDCVAVVSCLIAKDRRAEARELPDELEEIRESLIDIVRRLGQLQKELGLDIDPESYVEEKLSFTIMEACWEWAHGTPFLNILEVTSVHEGTLVNDITRVDGACREIAKAAQNLGDSALAEKFRRCSELIRRDVVFCTSLYLEP